MPTTAVDNDILVKGASFDLAFELIEAVPTKAEDVGILGAAPFVVKAILRKTIFSRPLDDVLKALDSLIHQVSLLEPTTEESRLAAELELAALVSSLDLDAGESQLCAIVVMRKFSNLVTGDKRAVNALESLMDARGCLSALSGKVHCLEQLFLRLVQTEVTASIRDAVCAESHVDKTLHLLRLFRCGKESRGMARRVGELHSRSTGDCANDSSGIT